MLKLINRLTIKRFTILMVVKTLNNKYREIIGKFAKVNLMHRIYLQKISSKNELYLGQLPILEYIINNDGCSQTDIVKFMGVTPPSVATSVKRMEASGLIKRKSRDTDQRCNILTLTDKGRELAKKCRCSFKEIDFNMFEVLSEEECKILENCLSKMLCNLSNEETENKTMFSLIEKSKELRRERSKGCDDRC